MKRHDAEQDPDPFKIGARKPSELKIGDWVKYHQRLPKRPGVEPVVTKVASEAWQLGDGTWIVRIEGRAGGVSTQFLEPFL
jgi:hypothetical protein